MSFYRLLICSLGSNFSVLTSLVGKVFVFFRNLFPASQGVLTTQYRPLVATHRHTNKKQEKHEISSVYTCLPALSSPPCLSLVAVHGHLQVGFLSDGRCSAPGTEPLTSGSAAAATPFPTQQRSPCNFHSLMRIRLEYERTEIQCER